MRALAVCVAAARSSSAASARVCALRESRLVTLLHSLAGASPGPETWP